MISLIIPGEPYAQKRPRATRIGSHARVYDPPENRNWKATAQQYMADEMAQGGCQPFTGPVRLVVLAGFTCPKSRRRKKVPRPAEPHTKRPDLDNIVKAVKDAATGILWLDDSQVCELTARKWTRRQGNPGQLEIMVQEVASE